MLSTDIPGMDLAKTILTTSKNGTGTVPIDVPIKIESMASELRRI